MASGLYLATFIDALTLDVNLDLEVETMKGALFSSSLATNFSTDTAHAATSEVTGTNWPAGGVALTGTELTIASGNIRFDATDVSVASVTVSGARYYRLYADALAGDNLVCLIDFGTDYSPQNGTLAITWNAAGLFTLDLTP